MAVEISLDVFPACFDSDLGSCQRHALFFFLPSRTLYLHYSLQIYGITFELFTYLLRCTCLDEILRNIAFSPAESKSSDKEEKVNAFRHDVALITLKPQVFQMTADNKELNVQIDSGAAVSVMSHHNSINDCRICRNSNWHCSWHRGLCDSVRTRSDELYY